MKKSVKVLIIIASVLFVIFCCVLAYAFTRVNVTLLPGGGAFVGGEESITVTVSKGEILEHVRLYTPQREGYRFGGWKIENDDSGEVLSSLFVFDDHVVLTPVWIEV